MATLSTVSQGPTKIKGGGVEGIDPLVNPVVNPLTGAVVKHDNPVIGAVNRILPHPTDVNIMYIGSVNGGVWRTTNAQDSPPTWTPLTDNLESTSIGALAFDTADTTYNTIIAGIGRTSALAFRGGVLSGLQILKTTDNGTTFTKTEVHGSGMLRGLNITGVVKHGDTIVVSVDKADTANYDNYGVFRSTNNGVTFTRVSGIPYGRAADMVVDPDPDMVVDPDPDMVVDPDPTNPSTIYVAIYNFQNGLVNGGYGGVYKSTDRGQTWSNVSTTAIEQAIKQYTKNIKLAVSKKRRVYVAISVGVSPANKGELTAIFSSQNGGSTWSSSSLSLPTTTENGVQYGIHPGGQGFVHFSFEADPNNEDIIYIGGDRQPSNFGGTNRNIMPSRYYTPGASDTPNTDATFPNSIGAETYSGRLFRGTVTPGTSTCAWVHLTHSNTLGATGGGTANKSAPHADSRDMVFDASGVLIECDDGGIYRRTQPQSNMGDWFSMNGNLQVTEIHSIVYDSVTKLITAGTQDNGTIQLVNPYSSIEPKIWNKISPGDGAVPCVDALLSPSLLYFSSQNLLSFKRVESSGNSYNFGGAQNVGLTSSDFSPQFYTPIKANSVVGGRLLLAGIGSVYESMNKGDNLTNIGGTYISTTLNMRNCSCIAYGGKKRTEVEPALYQDLVYPEVAYACKDNIVYIRKPTESIFSHYKVLPFNKTFRKITDISVAPLDWDQVFVVSVHPTPQSSGKMSSVHMTKNAGDTWIEITGILATSNIGEIYTCDIIRNSAGNLGGLVVGTEAGVWLLKRSDINGITATTTHTDLSSLGWIKVGGTQIPNAQISDINYNPADDILVVGTLGRGAWSISGLYNVAVQGSTSGSAFEEPQPEPEPEVVIPVYPNRISSMVLKVTQGTNIYQEPIILPSASATSLGTKSINISNIALINAINISESGTIFYPEIITTYDAGTYTVRAYGSPFVVP
jgi:hypothetical protein